MKTKRKKLPEIMLSALLCLSLVTSSLTTVSATQQGQSIPETETVSDITSEAVSQTEPEDVFDASPEATAQTAPDYEAVSDTVPDNQSAAASDIAPEDTSDAASDIVLEDTADAALVQTGVSENGTTPDADKTDAPESDAPVTAETEANVITITFFDTDKQTVLYGPITKDLSELKIEASKGRYIFDTINESGASVATTEQEGVYQLPHIYKGRKIAKWQKSSEDKSYTYANLQNKLRLKADDSFTPIYAASDYSYALSYDWNGGDLSDGEEGPESFTVNSETITLPSLYKGGYIFNGWKVTNESAGSAYGSVIKEIPAGTYIDYTYGEIQNNVYTGYQLQADWTQIKVETPSISSVNNKKTGEAVVTIKPNPAEKQTVSYELSYGTKKNFSKANTHVVDIGSKTSYKLTNMPKGKTYYFRVRAYVTDAHENNTYSAYSAAVSKKITKGVTETKKISSKSAKLTASNVKIDSDKNLYVKATVSKRLKSYDDFYYLVSVDPDNGKIIKSVASSDKNKTVIFKTPVRTDGGVNLINGKYALAVKTSKKKFKQISSAFFIRNPEAAADYTAAYPVTASKKGIQDSVDTELGVQQRFTNVMLNDILNGSVKYKYNGKTYYFNEPTALTNYASACNANGITCSAQLMLRWPGTGKYGCLLYGTKSPSSPTGYYAINASTQKSREMVEAAFSFLADRCSKADCHVDNWILGNEVNIYKSWYYAGNTGKDAFMKNYANSFRILYNSVKGRNKNAHVFICTDHTWINRSGDWGAKPFMDSFNKDIKAMNPKIQWNLAYHAYPAILYIPTTWKDSYTSNSQNTDFVTPKNLNVLTDYVKKNFGKNTRIIISECGFTSAEGEENQAAALAYSFYKAQFNDMIDAFIIRTVNDAVGEKLTKLNGSVIDANFGLCTADGKKRASYNVFKYMDTPQYAKYTDSYLKTIGKSSWKSAIPGFNDKKLKAMPNRK